MEYTELEQKVIAKGIKNFRKELEEASKPMLAVLKKYKITCNHPLLKEITLRYPHDEFASFSNYAVAIPNDKELESIKSAILENFIKEIDELKEKISDLEL